MASGCCLNTAITGGQNFNEDWARYGSLTAFLRRLENGNRLATLLNIQRWIIQPYSVTFHRVELQVRERALFLLDVAISFVRSNLQMVLTNRAVRTKAERKKRGIMLIVAFRWNAPEYKGFLWQLVTHFDRDRQITQGFTWKDRDQKSHRGLRLQSRVNVLFCKMGLYCHTVSLPYHWYIWELNGSLETKDKTTQ